MRRAILSVTMCLLALAAACTGGPSAGPQPTGTANGELVVASGLDVTGTDGVRQQLIAEWNKTPEGKRHRARLVELPGGADQQRSQLLGALQSGSAQYDVVNLDVTWVPEFAEAGVISSLDNQVDLSKDFIGSVADTARWKGHTYAVPFNSDVGLLYYRPDYLESASVERYNYPGPGTTWSQLRSLIRSLNAAPPSGYMKGWTSQLASYEGLTVNAIEAFASVGVQLTDGEGHYKATPASLRKGLDALTERTDSDYTLPAALTSHEAESLSDFAAGRTAFLRHWPYAYHVLPQTLADTSVAVAPLPGGAVLGGQNLAVTAGSPQSAYALELIRFLTSKKNERCLLDAGFAATRTSAYTDAGVRCGLASPTPSAPGKAPAAGENHDMPRDPDGRPRYASSTLLPALKTAVQRPRTPYYGAFTQALQSRLHAWLLAPDTSRIDQVATGLDHALAKTLKGE